MYYPCSENKGADQLRGYHEADLRLCFRIGKNPVFSRCGSNGLESAKDGAERCHHSFGLLQYEPDTRLTKLSHPVFEWNNTLLI